MLPTPPSRMTRSGTRQKRTCLKQFDNLIVALASVNASRRGSQNLDDSDFSSAFQQLLSPRPRPLILDVLAEFGLLMAGGLVGYSATILTSPTANRGPGGVMLATGIFIAALCAVIKHIKI